MLSITRFVNSRGHVIINLEIEFAMLVSGNLLSDQTMVLRLHIFFESASCLWAMTLLVIHLPSRFFKSCLALTSSTPGSLPTDSMSLLYTARTCDPATNSQMMTR